MCEVDLVIALIVRRYRDRNADLTPRGCVRDITKGIEFFQPGGELDDWCNLIGADPDRVRVGIERMEVRR